MICFFLIPLCAYSGTVECVPSGLSSSDASVGVKCNNTWYYHTSDLAYKSTDCSYSSSPSPYADELVQIYSRLQDFRQNFVCSHTDAANRNIRAMATNRFYTTALLAYAKKVKLKLYLDNYDKPTYFTKYELIE